MNYLGMSEKIILYNQAHKKEELMDEYDIVLTETTGKTIKFDCDSEKDWGDGTTGTASQIYHTYNDYGSYTIKANGKLGENAFVNAEADDQAILVSVRLANLSMGDFCFAMQERLTSVTFCGRETEIPRASFYDTGISSMSIPVGITSIGEGAFVSCHSLTSVSIPSSVVEIGERAFQDCRMSSITIPSSVTRIERLLFRACYFLANIYLPSSISYIGKEAFFECNDMGDQEVDIHYDGTKSQWNSIEKETGWDAIGNISVTVHCTDGNISI